MDRDRIEKLQAQVAEIGAELELLKAEPEWVPFPGEMIEVRSSDEDSWRIRIATGEVVGRRVHVFCDGEMGGQVMGWEQSRRLSDLNVIQLQQHTPSDLMPCERDQHVLCRMANGSWTIGIAHHVTWPNVNAWALLPSLPQT